MMQRRHRRRTPYARSFDRAIRLRRLAALGVLVVLLFIAGSKVLSWFGVGNAIRRTATTLSVEDQGVISVSVDGGPLKNAENDVKLYAGDTVVSSPRNYATLTFFDESSVRMDESTEVHILESFEGEKHSELAVELAEGTVWMATPRLSTYSGSITRTVRSSYLSAEVPSQAEIVLSPRSLTVFSADGLGLEVTVAGNDRSVVVGEGQQFTLPEGHENEADLYAFRNPISSEQLQSQFVEESRTRYATRPTPGTATPAAEEGEQNDTTLIVETPENGVTVDTSTVKVSGRIGNAIEKVRINGYLASVNIDAGTFTQELTLPDEDDVSIVIEGVDNDGVVVAEAIRNVKRDRKPPEPPTIELPAKSGQTYRTNRTEIEISGKAPENIVGIVVNDYRLQLFTPGKTEWSYLANTEFSNFKPGRNVYEVYAINRGGFRSEPATITIILGEGEEGVVSEGGEGTEGAGGTEASVRPPLTAEETNLPKNLPLMPGSITIYSPGAGTAYVTSEPENVIEGNVPSEAESVWVNGYRLRLFEPGKTFFNYIASVELNTLRRGRNVYRIVVRGKDGYILDALDYVLTFNP